MSKIENWSIQIKIADVYKAPEQGVSIVVGKVYDDVRACDGAGISTSRIVNLDIKNMTIQTKNTLYNLGKIDPDFERYMVSEGFTINDYVEGINMPEATEYK